MQVLTRILQLPVHSRRRLALASRLAALVLSPATSGSEPARVGRTHEYDLKAVFLFQFARFVTWPAGSFRDENTPIIIGVLGEDPFGPALDEVVAGEVVGTRRLDVRRYQLVDQVGACHILFISASEADRLPAVLSGLRGRNVLTVGDTKDFAARGGMVGFTASRNRLKLRVNLAAADSANLTISSKLLRQAEVVRKGAKG